MTIQRLAYTAPKLTIFGAMSELTAGGASGATESKFINKGSCGTNLAKKCG
jgi:hypothetical protein